MGLFGGIGKAIKGVGKTIGKVASTAAPFAGFIPGVGPLAAGALAAGGAALTGKNLKDIAKAGLLGGGGAFLGGKALGALGSKVPQVVRNGIPSKVTDLISAGGGAPATVSSGGGFADKLKGIGSGVLGAVKSHPELALAAVGGLQHAQDSARTDKLYGQGLGDIRGAYAAKAPLRAMALKQLQDPRLIDLSKVFRPRGNPFASAA